MANIKEEIRREKLKSRIKLAFELSVIVIAVFIGYMFIPNPGMPPSPPGITNVAYLSEYDSEIQARIKNATGYDWSLIEKQDGSDAEKSAALLLLANEVNAVREQAASMTKEELSRLGLEELNASDTSKENIVRLIKNLKKIDGFYSIKNPTSEQNHSGRLSFLESYFSDNGLPSGVLDDGSQYLIENMTGVPVNTHTIAMKVLIIKYNLMNTNA